MKATGHMQHPRRIARLKRHLRNKLGRQLEIE
jgi:hypothetical protein